MKRVPDFNLVARPYRWLEYLTLGRTLERCRLHFLPHLADRKRALVLGDGDGRFLARLLASNGGLTADAVDASAAMLTLLRNRCAFAFPRLTTYHTDALAFLASRAPVAPYDLVVTHFFLDCLMQPEVDALAASIAPQLAANAIWLVSDFQIPRGIVRFPAQVLVRCLYLGFRTLTGLRPARLPDHALSLTRASLFRIAEHRSLLGILTTELWTDSPSRPDPSIRIEL